MKREVVRAISLVFVLVAVGGSASAQGGRGPGRGFGRGFHGANDKAFAKDHETIHFLLDHGGKIQRNVKLLKNGIETLTESKDSEVAGKIQEHVASMYSRLDEKRPIRMRDPLFAELFKHAEKIEMKMTKTANGIRVVETSRDPKVVALLHEHAKVVSKFIKFGRTEARKNHAVPKIAQSPAATKTSNPSTAACCGQGKACVAKKGTEGVGKACCGACRKSTLSKATKPKS